MTLLVLPLAELASQAQPGGVDAFLTDHGSGFVAFTVSFVVIAVIWTEHHRLFEMLVSYDGPLIALTFVWLFAIVLIPFSTAITQDRPVEDRLASALYIGNLLLAFVPQVIDEGCRRTFRVGSSIGLAVICAVAHSSWR